MFRTPKWPVPKAVKALYTTRKGGVSKAPFDELNLAQHVGDETQSVEENRRRLVEQAKLPSLPFWLNQQHTDIAIQCSNSLSGASFRQSAPPVADASWTVDRGCVLAIMTADCLPLLITNRQGTVVCAIHAGWKGLQQGIIKKTVLELCNKVEGVCPQELLVWIGPAIQQRFFEVGEEVLEQFLSQDSLNQSFFMPVPMVKTGGGKKYLADLAGLATRELKQLGVTDILSSHLCSYAQEQLFYSYRRSGQTGRMASLIWME